ncbi:UNVERIFIED_CONTAM: hypothetical protein FKN15_070890 [Acipenser sinensis]
MNMLGTLAPNLKTNWHDYVDAMTHAYNCTQHDSTGYAPYFLMFGRHPRLPIDVIFGLSSGEEPVEYSEFVQNLHDCLSFAFDQANQMSRHAKEQQKEQYDRKARDCQFQPGDRVLVKNCHVEGRQKLADRWESPPYVVVKKQPGIPVYVVRSEDGEKERVVHRNLLTQSMFFPMEREQTQNDGVSPSEGEVSESDVSDSESDVDVEVITSPPSSPQPSRPSEELTDLADDQKEAYKSDVDSDGSIEGTPGKEILDGDTTVNTPLTQDEETVSNLTTQKRQIEFRLQQSANLDQAPVSATRSQPLEPLRRYPLRERHPPKKLAYRQAIPVFETNTQKIERGRKIWHKVRLRVLRKETAV